MRLLIAYVIGAVFGLGIAISGMANPAKVVIFFDVTGAWDPSLAFVMGGALLVTGVGYRLVFTRPAPALAPAYDLPTNRDIDARLVTGAAIFGMGWGIAGFCPGGALPALGTMQMDVGVVVASLSAGIWITKALQSRIGGPVRARGAPHAPR